MRESFRQAAGRVRSLSLTNVRMRTYGIIFSMRNYTRTYYVYIMFSRSGVLYIGVTNNLLRRVYEHKRMSVRGFTQKYRVVYLAFFEETDDITVAISREKELKKWRREKKLALIATQNPDWDDLSAGWYEEEV